MEARRLAPEIRKRLRAVGLSAALIDELAEDEPRIDLAQVCSVLEYGRRAARGSRAALRSDFEETRATVASLTRELKRTQRWYRGHVDDIGDESPGLRELMPVYYATRDLLALLEDGTRDPLVIIAAGAEPHIERLRGKPAGGRPRRPWLAMVRRGLNKAGCSEERISGLLVAAGFFAPARKS